LQAQAMFYFKKIIANRILVQPSAYQRLKMACSGLRYSASRRPIKAGPQSSNSPSSGLFTWLIWRLFTLWNQLSLPNALFHRAHMQVAQRCFDIRMAQQFLDEARVRTRLQQVRGEAVAQGVGRDGIAQARCPAGALHHRLQAAHGIVLARVLVVGCRLSVDGWYGYAATPFSITQPKPQPVLG
jgi:hypothetical protein